MSYFFNISVCLFLVILQTTVMPYLPLMDSFYDLLIPFVVFLGLSRPVPTQQVEQSFADQVQKYRMGRRSNIKKGIAANEELNQLAVQNQVFFFNAGQGQVQEFQQKMISNH